MLKLSQLPAKDRGGSAILVSISLLLLVGIVAFTVDLGDVFNEDRQDQTAADVGALAGVLEYVIPSDPDAVRTQVFDFVEQNLRQSYTATEWETMWSTCTDPAKPSGFNPVRAPTGWSVTNIDCISGSTTELRVRVPDQLVETQFGRVLGVDEIATRAVAHARVQYRQAGAVKPFGILSGIGAGSTCLTTAPSGLGAPPCDGPDSGNFGTLNSQTWNEDPNMDNVVDCGTPGVDELSLNIAIGVDHYIGLAGDFAGTGGPYSSFPSSTTRLDDCQVVGGKAEATDSTPELSPVNTLRADTGFNLFHATKAGMISGTAADFPNSNVPVTPLLRQTSMSGSMADRILRERISGTIYEYDVDNTPLWEHLLDSSSLSASGLSGALHSSCLRATIVAAPNPSDAMSACLQAYEAALNIGTPLGPLFDDSVSQNPRFGWVPQFHFSTWGSGNHWQPVKDYRMIYIDTIWFNCNGKYDPTKNDEPCTGTKGLVFRPDLNETSDMQVGNGGSMKELRLDQISAFLIPPQAVSNDVADSYPGNIRGPFETVLTR